MGLCVAILTDRIPQQPLYIFDIEGLVTQKGLKGVLLHRCDSNFGASGGPIFAQFSNGNYDIVGLHSDSADLKQSQGSAMARFPKSLIAALPSPVGQPPLPI